MDQMAEPWNLCSDDTEYHIMIYYTPIGLCCCVSWGGGGGGGGHMADTVKLQPPIHTFY